MIFLLENQNEIRKLKSSLIKYFDSEQNFEVTSLLKLSQAISMQINYDNWNGGTYYYVIIFELDVEEYSKVRPFIEEYCESIRQASELFLHLPMEENLSEIRISPICKYYLDWSNVSNYTNSEEILREIENIKQVLISVATGESLINDVQADYQRQYFELDKYLKLLGVDNPNTISNLWDWYKRWKSPDLDSYAKRRAFFNNLYEGLITMIVASPEQSSLYDYELTGWERVDRSIYEMQKILSYASTEEQFQSIGFYGRETLITIALEVYNGNIHISEEKIEVSKTDAKRMLTDYLSYELAGPSNEDSRRFAKAAVSLANSLTHDRMAKKRDAKLCFASVASVVSIIKSIYETEEIPF